MQKIRKHNYDINLYQFTTTSSTPVIGAVIWFTNTSTVHVRNGINGAGAIKVKQFTDTAIGSTVLHEAKCIAITVLFSIGNTT